MPRYLLLVSALLLLGSGALSLLNKGKLSASIAANTQAQQKVAAAQTDASKARNDLKKAQKDVADAHQSVTDMKTQVDGLKSQVNDLTTKSTAADADVKAKQGQIDDLTTRLAAAGGSKSVAPDDTAAKQMVDLQHARDELQLVKDSLDTQLKAAQTQLAAVQKHQQDLASGAAMLGLRGKVLAVNREYNFVVLDLGSRNGVSGNATMLIERGGSLVGRVRTGSVEPSHSVAYIVPN